MDLALVESRVLLHFSLLLLLLGNHVYFAPVAAHDLAATDHVEGLVAFGACSVVLVALLREVVRLVLLLSGFLELEVR